MNRSRLASAGLAAAVAALTILTGGPAAALPRDSPTPTPSANDGLPLTMTLGRLEPRAPQPGDLITIEGTATDTGSLPVRDLALQLRVSSVPVHTRDELAELASDVNGPLPGTVRNAARVALSTQQLSPGRTATWRVTVKVDDLALPEPWLVYKMGVEIVGCSDQGCGALGRLRTFLPWAPLGPGAAKPTRIAWVWPLVDRPHRAGGPVFTDGGLAPELAAGGRLDGLLSAAVAAARTPPPQPKVPARPGSPARPRVQTVSVPVTWAIDPMLAEDVSLMASGYQVAVPGKPKPQPGPGVADAKTWLSTLRAAVHGTPVIALPYADVDATALVHNGLTNDLRVAMTSGQLLAHRLLGTDLLGGVAWPPGSLVDQHTLDTLFGSRIDTVLLADSALPPREDPGRTPDARTTVSARDGSLTAVLADSTLHTIADQGSHANGGPRNAEQRFLAETLMITAEAPSLQRDVVVAPERGWDPLPKYAAALLADSGKVPWLTPVTLEDVEAGPASTVERAGLTYPQSAARAELSPGYLSAVSDVRSRLDGLASMLPPDDPTVRDLDSAVFRAESAAWRSHPDAAATMLGDVAGAVDGALGKLRIASAPGSLITLTSHSGRVPVTVANDLGSPARVVLRLDAGERMSIEGAGSLVEVLPPHRQVTVEVSASARTAGVFPLTVSLETPQSPRQQLQKVELLVRSTVYGTVALVITGAAAAALMLAALVRLARRAARARRAAGAAE